MQDRSSTQWTVGLSLFVVATAVVVVVVQRGDRHDVDPRIPDAARASPADAATALAAFVAGVNPVMQTALSRLAVDGNRAPLS